QPAPSAPHSPPAPGQVMPGQPAPSTPHSPPAPGQVMPGQPLPEPPKSQYPVQQTQPEINPYLASAPVRGPNINSPNVNSPNINSLTRPAGQAPMSVPPNLASPVTSPQEQQNRGQTGQANQQGATPHIQSVRSTHTTPPQPYQPAPNVQGQKPSDQSGAAKNEFDEEDEAEF
ncbi:MAG: hypothetical protein K8F91_18030, partial [Candidatus Obscuribacterales bacterium]|nr:hypothetical protein [Candidatus Obscuribacterales bacterium]